MIEIERICNMNREEKQTQTLSKWQDVHVSTACAVGWETSLNQNTTNFFHVTLSNYLDLFLLQKFGQKQIFASRNSCKI